MSAYAFLIAFSFIASVLLCWFFKYFAADLKLVVNPGEHRQHDHPTPVVGGIAIFLSMFICVSGFLPDYLPLMGVLTLLLLIGVVDDLISLPSILRFLIQAVAVYAMIEVTGVRLGSLGYLYSDTPISLGQWSYPLTIFAGIGVINAINMSDGMDGLVGCLALVCCGALVLMSSPDSTLALVLFSAVAGFLYWNARFFRSRAALFMGDAGSTVLGLLLAYLLINASQGAIAVIAPVTALWLVALPLIDTVALLLARPILGRSPFSADHLHYHHFLRRLGLSVNQTLMVAVSLQIAFCGLAFYLQQNQVSESIQLTLFLGFFGVYLLAIIAAGRKQTAISN